MLLRLFASLSSGPGDDILYCISSTYPNPTTPGLTHAKEQKKNTNNDLPFPPQSLHRTPLSHTAYIQLSSTFFAIRSLEGTCRNCAGRYIIHQRDEAEEEVRTCAEAVEAGVFAENCLDLGVGGDSLVGGTEGDLFDGGREWATGSSSSPDARFKMYGNDVWMMEYRRFVEMFFDTWRLWAVDSKASGRGRKIIASLPGNHDLGFGHGIQKPVLKRFRTYFGDGNRVDVLGNHTFVSVDTVSLSAMDEPNPETGDSGDASSGDEIWREVEKFLEDLPNLKARAVKEELLALQGKAENYSAPSTIVNARNPTQPVVSSAPSDAELPTIILTHVPLYREPGTPCGPLRERFPPSSTDPLPEKDERNAIRVSRGYQYQNVLTETISKRVVTSAGAGVKQVYSGDDHDYCEISHHEFSGSPKEITVKSMSLAMGVRRPGFQMASLYNPVDLQTGKSINPDLGLSSSSTIQNHLCLLPDQISIFIQYAYVLLLTIVALFVRAISRTFQPLKDPSITSHDFEYLLPISHQPHYHHHQHLYNPSTSTTFSTSSTSSTTEGEKCFSHRATTNSGGGGGSMLSRTASSSPPSHDGLLRPTKHAQIIDVTGTHGGDKVSESLRRSDLEIDEKIRDRSWGVKSWGSAGSAGHRGFKYVLWAEFMKPFTQVLVVGGLWYFWLVRTWL
ncbi:hypothetical protein ACO22_07398 [Paracoccidioides brasiliensis]|uniref:Calcineurin-like phosphoesterase domain-containing protein n=1 Tax=Paracoccidioides brasiliensis TaxID=121759 RepID=A0A1D2J4T4_PARBR|nr:hypothetical protein ACO22_07398 [Paracoccidioides brasiliensis]